MTTIDPSTETISFDAYLDLISDKSFAGEDNAEDLDTLRRSHLPVGSGMPGADEAIEWFQSRLETPTSPSFLMLIGGPGNGKSFLAKRVAEPFAEEEIDKKGAYDDLVQRTRHFRVSGSTLSIVNDATIPIPSEPTPLIFEIENSISEKSHLLANANRGILLEELANKSQDSSTKRLGYALVDWLLNGATSNDLFEVGGIKYRFKETSGPSHHFMNSIKIVSDEITVEVVAVNLDLCSLFEERPKVGLSTETNLPTPKSGYRITPFYSRRETNVDEKSPAGPLLDKVIAGCPAFPELPDNTANPITANFESLSHEVVRSGVLQILRASELVGTRRMTYRDFWGATEQLTRGPLCPKGQTESPTEWVLKCQPPPLEAGKELQHLLPLMRLSQARFHQALFNAKECPLLEQWNQLGDLPATRMASLIDPVKDALSGHINLNSGKGGGWASPVLEAFEGRDKGDSILDAFKDALGEEDPALLALTPFEQVLDCAISNALDGELEHSSGPSRQLLSWYGEYLLRFYATVHGISSFFNELTLWTSAWSRAHENPNFESPIDSEVKTLVAPRFPQKEGAQNRLLLPVFDSRTVPIVNETTEPTLAKSINQQNYVWRTSGDSLFLILNMGNDQTIELDFDFPLLHEAMACKNGSPGLTEATHVAAPRLERFRSSMLQSPSAELVLVDHEKIEPIQAQKVAE
jgi:hypothetical protein